MEPRKSKSPQESFTVYTELVLPNDTNSLTNLMGGNLMKMMDIAGAIAAQKHSNSIVVTASVDNISFSNPIRLGHVVTMHAKVTRAFKTSMEIHIEVWSENIPANIKYKSNEAYFTFVAMDAEGRNTIVPEVIPQTEDEIKLYDGALRRRQLRLILAGKMKASDATELKSLFDLK